MGQCRHGGLSRRLPRLGFNADPPSHANADPDAYADTYVNANSNADSYSNAFADTNPDPYADRGSSNIYARNNPIQSAQSRYRQRRQNGYDRQSVAQLNGAGYR